MRKKTIIGLSFFIVFISILSIVSASGIISLYDCGVLNVEGGIYELQNDVSSSETCFAITANNITLDLNGYNIIGDSVGIYECGIRIIYGPDQITIMNGFIYRFWGGYLFF